MSRKVVLFFCPSMQAIAEEMLTRHGGRALFEAGAIDWARFPDGTPNFTIQNPERLRHRDVVFLAHFDTMGAIAEQLMTIATLTRRYPLRSLKILLPFYPTGTKDRWEKPGEVVTALELARMMSFIPRPDASRVELVVYDIHALQEESFFPDNIRVNLQSAAPIITEHFTGMEDIAIAFPDEGAGKRFKNHFTGFPQIYCEKRRVGDDRQVWVREGDPTGKHVFIVDDLGLTGGTAIQAMRALKDMGAREVSMFVTHGLFPQDASQRVAGAGFSEIWMTDSCPQTVSKVQGMKPFRIVGLAASMVELIQREMSEG